MNDIFKSAKIATNTASVLVVILGIFLVMYPGSAVITVCRIAGALILIAGAVALLSFFFGRGGSGFVGMQADIFRLIIGAILLAIGLFVTIQPGSMVGFISILFGVILFMHALNGVREMIELKRLNDGRWYLSLVYVIATFAMGVVILVSPLGSAKFAMTLTGVFLIISGALSLLTGLRVIHYGRRYRKEHPEEPYPGRKKDIIDLPPEDVQEEDMGPGRPFE